jgi:hypothetical protein
MSVLNESIVEDAALEWFGDLGYAVGHWPQLAPGELAAERQPKRSGDSRRQSFGEVAPVGRLREASHSRGGTGNRQGILVSSKHIERRLNP